MFDLFFEILFFSKFSESHNFYYISCELDCYVFNNFSLVCI